MRCQFKVAVYLLSAIPWLTSGTGRFPSVRHPLVDRPWLGLCGDRDLLVKLIDRCDLAAYYTLNCQWTWWTREAHADHMECSLIEDMYRLKSIPA